jgi:outer membrane protein TolC
MTKSVVKALIVVLGLFVGMGAQAETLTLEQCLRTTVNNNEMLHAAALEITVRENQQKSVRGRFGPLVKLDGNLIFWQDAQNITFDLSFLGDIFADLMPILPEETQQKILAMSENPMTIPVRESITYGAGVTVAQPLVSIYKVWAGYEAAGELAAAARMNTLKARRDLQLRVATAYYGMVTARELERTAQAGLTQVEEIERQVAAFLEAQMVERNALLKVQVRKAEIQKGLFQAQKGALLAQAALNLYMNRPLEDLIEPVMPSNENVDMALLDTPVSKQQQIAVEQRPDLMAAQRTRAAAKAGHHAAIADMLPEINAFFKYENNQGYGELQPENNLYGGLQLTWTIWEWGATWYKLKEAEARLEQAALATSFTEDQVRMDVVVKRLDLEEALKNLAVARVQLEQADENLRVEQIRYDVQQTTTADLLGAQTQKMRAEADAIVALLKIKESSLELLVAMGGDLIEN